MYLTVYAVAACSQSIPRFILAVDMCRPCLYCAASLAGPEEKSFVLLAIENYMYGKATKQNSKAVFQMRCHFQII